MLPLVSALVFDAAKQVFFNKGVVAKNFHGLGPSHASNSHRLKLGWKVKVWGMECFVATTKTLHFLRTENHSANDGNPSRCHPSGESIAIGSMVFRFQLGCLAPRTNKPTQHWPIKYSYQSTYSNQLTQLTYNNQSKQLINSPTKPTNQIQLQVTQHQTLCDPDQLRILIRIQVLFFWSRGW